METKVQISDFLSKTKKKYSEENKNILELSKILDKEILEFLVKNKKHFFSKKLIIDLLYINYDKINYYLSKTKEPITLINNRSTIAHYLATHFFLTPFVISQIKQMEFKDVFTIISNIDDI